MAAKKKDPLASRKPTPYGDYQCPCGLIDVELGDNPTVDRWCSKLWKIARKKYIRHHSPENPETYFQQ